MSTSADLELLPLKGASHTYSSLRDLLQPLKATRPGSDICIRNRLVKQAARAYLRPMSDYPSSAGGNFFHRLWSGVVALIDLFCTKVVRILDGAFRINNLIGDT
ncbi:hypothetical protein SASPL_108771 [Salvia splendens]|uniref:Uncharacterized protein n=1 Tax=Salvia splendens TaxID=180675 RepID=A0A8X8YFB9_SALSN|nr:uncharacterized protein LOC121796834 [Salvia splendens]KAG6430699.1 hypothetical protein SASPL_108771 [Salvia splendens]